MKMRKFKSIKEDTIYGSYNIKYKRVVICKNVIKIVFGIVEIIYYLIRCHYEFYTQMSQKKIYVHFRKRVYNKVKEIDYACFEDAE